MQGALPVKELMERCIVGGVAAADVISAEDTVQ